MTKTKKIMDCPKGEQSFGIVPPESSEHGFHWMYRGGNIIGRAAEYCVFEWDPDHQDWARAGNDESLHPTTVFKSGWRYWAAAVRPENPYGEIET